MKISIVIPAYNEEKRITATLKDVDAYLKKQSYDYEIIVVVNNSKDKTYEIVKQLEQTSISKATALNLKEGGKGNAVKQGILEKASGDIVLFMDADNATPISEIEKFLPYFQQGFDVVIGSRYTDPSLVKHKQPFYRVLLSRLSNMLIQFLAVPGIKDTQLGFKGFTKKAALDIFPLVSILRWGFDMEVLTVALAHGFKIKEVGVSWTEHGGSHVPLKAYIESLIDLFKIKLNSMRGFYQPRRIQVSHTVVTNRDYDLGALAGFLTGICLIPTALNVGFDNIIALIIFPFVTAVGIVFGIWLGKTLSRFWAAMFQLSKFAAVGILNTAIDFGILNLLSLVAHVTSGLSAGGINVPATLIAASNSYFWNKLWVFKKIDNKGLFHDIPGFAAVTIIGLLIKSLIIVVFTTYLQPSFDLSKEEWLNAGKGIATILGVLIDYLGYKYIVFRIVPPKNPTS